MSGTPEPLDPMTPTEQLVSSMHAHLVALQAELDAYRGWLDEQNVEIIPRDEITDAMQAIVDATAEFDELRQRATDSDAPRLLELVATIGHAAILWSCRLRDERQALKKGLN